MINFSDAPKGATHYLADGLGCVDWFKVSGDLWYGKNENLDWTQHYKISDAKSRSFNPIKIPNQSKLKFEFCNFKRASDALRAFEDGVELYHEADKMRDAMEVIDNYAELCKPISKRDMFIREYSELQAQTDYSLKDWAGLVYDKLIEGK